MTRRTPLAPAASLLLAGLALACSGGPQGDAGASAAPGTSPPQSEPELPAGATADSSSDASPSSDDATSTDPSTDPSTTAEPTDAQATMDQQRSSSDDSTLEVATLGAGCYWCVEAVLEQVDGVKNVVSGFMGGEQPDPTYAEVCAGTTGHAEVVQVEFDPQVLPYEHLLAWFWKLHDPTTLNRQGADVGTQYRSAIFTHSEQQAATARRSKAAAQADFADPIVTEITPASEFYLAPDKHQDYYWANKEQGYCRAVIAPKLKKLELEH